MRIRIFLKIKALGSAVRYYPGILGFAMLALAFLPVSGQTPESLSDKAELFRNKSQFDSALYYFKEIKNLNTIQGNSIEIIKSELNISDILITTRNFNEAEEIFNKLGKTFANRGTPFDKLLPEYYQCKGWYFLALGETDSSKTYLLKSLSLRRSHSNSTDTLLRYAWNKLGNLYFLENKFDSALFCHDSALKLSLRKRNPINFQSASSYQNLGIASYKVGDIELAEQYFLKALEINESLFTDSDPSLISIYGNIGKFYSELSKYDLSIKFFDKAEKVFVRSQTTDNIAIAPIFWNKGNLYMHLGDYEKALSYLNKTFDIYNNDELLTFSQLPSIQMDIGLVYDAIGNNKLAIHHYKASIRNNNNPSIIKAFRNLGNVYNRLNSPDSARYYYNQAIKYSIGYFGEISFDLGLCYEYYGWSLRNTNIEESLYYLEKALFVFQSLFGRNNRDVARVKLRITDIYIDRNDFDNASILINEASRVLTQNFTIKDLISKENLISYIDLYIPDALNVKARMNYRKFILYRKTDLLIDALTSIQESWSITELIRKSFKEEESQIVLNSNARTTIDLGIRICLELYWDTGDQKYAEEAFRFSERGKSLVMLGALRGLEAAATTSLPAVLLEREKKLKSDIRLYNNLLYEEARKKSPDPGKISLWNDKLFSTRKSYDSLVGGLKESYPDYHRLKYDFSVGGITEVQAALASDQSLVSFHVADSTVYGFFIGKSSFEAAELGPSGVLLSQLDSLQSLYKSSEYFNPEPEDFLRMIRLNSTLYQFLLGPFKNFITTERLVIVPDGELGYLSFDQLVIEDSHEIDEGFGKVNWLVRHFAISYSSSATIFVEYAAPLKPGKNNGKVMAFAPSYDFQASHRNIGTDEDSILEMLSPIKWTAEEVESISGIYRTRKLQGEEATESAFKNDAGDYRILHLAMHTLIDNENPLNSKLVFTKPGESVGDDGLLNTWELFNMDLSGDLAVLSACNTGTGKLERGEGIISLARGFFYAGVPSVVMTLWEIEDRSSVQLMTLFYEQLRNGLPKDRALQQAKLEYIRNAGKLKSHPYFWAGFVNIGNTDPMPPTQHNTLNTIIILSSVALIAFFLLYLFINRRVYFRKKPL